MKFLVFGLLALPLVAQASDVATDKSTQALAAIGELGAVNGQALACRVSDVAAKAKALMLEHSPRTTAYGDAFREATNAAFMRQTQQAPEACPDPATLSRQLDALAARLNDLLPANDGGRQ